MSDFDKRLQDTVLKIVLDSVDVIRAESEYKLRKILTASFGKEDADNLAHYFFGPNPNIKQLTASVIRDLKIVENLEASTKS